MWRGRIALAACLTIGLGLGVAAGCGDGSDESPTGDVTLTEPGTTFTVEPGEEFTIVLESNITTGFAWALETEPSPDVVRLVDDVYVGPESDVVGMGGRQELTFEGVGEGSGAIELWYVRSFDDPLEPADRASFDVVVGG